MGCCEVLLKAILIITNVIVLLSGVLLLVLGGIFYTKQFDMFPELEEYSTSITSVLIAMLVIGGLLVLIGIIGCFGACTGKSGLLNVYFVVVLIFVILQIVVIALAVVKKSDFEEAAVEQATELFDEYKTQANAVAIDLSVEKAVGVNLAQFTFQCCGVETGPAWWGTNQFTPGCCDNFDRQAFETSIGDDQGGQTKAKLLISACPDSGEVFKTGCKEQVTSMASEFSTIIIIVVVVLILFEIVCLAAACVSKKRDLVA